MREECVHIIKALEKVSAQKWAETFVQLKMNFWRKYCKGLVFSTSHGIDFFENILCCLDGETWNPKNKGEYEENFRKFIKMYQ